jgi:Zn-dependent protease
LTSIIENPLLFLASILVLLFSIILHEVAHGWVAERLGDPTARMAGRITFNPLPHIDLFGTVILPVSLILLHSPFVIGWAKPVPVNFYRLRRPRRDTMLVSLAGILSNLTLAILISLVWRLVLLFVSQTGTVFFFFANVVSFTVGINLLLAVFNLVPVPPLDGSKMVGALLPPRWEAVLFNPQFSLIGTFVLFALLYTGLLWRILDPIRIFLQNILLP